MQRVGLGRRRKLVAETAIDAPQRHQVHFISFLLCPHTLMFQTASSIPYYTFISLHFLLPPRFVLFMAWRLTFQLSCPSSLRGGGASCTLYCILIRVDMTCIKPAPSDEEEQACVGSEFQSLIIHSTLLFLCDCIV